MDAFLARDPVTFEAYAINDCRVVLEYYLGTMQAHEVMFGVTPRIPLTLGDATVRTYLSWLDTPRQLMYCCGVHINFRGALVVQFWGNGRAERPNALLGIGKVGSR